jgi:hypothetical protein
MIIAMMGFYTKFEVPGFTCVNIDSDIPEGDVIVFGDYKKADKKYFVTMQNAMIMERYFWSVWNEFSEYLLSQDVSKYTEKQKKELLAKNRKIFDVNRYRKNVKDLEAKYKRKGYILVEKIPTF